MPKKSSKESQRVIDQHRERLGWVQPHNYTLAEVLPEVIEAKSSLYSNLFKEKHLSAKTKALIHVALSSARFAQGTKQHVKHAIKTGATKEEIVEAIALTLVTFGGQAARWGIDALDAVLGNERVVDESGLPKDVVDSGA
jgi:alkylhydroperoxidase/carboxymuconolactone decarboxylase family protein YurZ